MTVDLTRVTPRLIAEAAVVLVAVLAGWAYVHQRDNRLRAEGELQLVRERADSSAQVAQAAVARSIGAEAAAEEATRREGVARAAASAAAARAAARAPAAAERVVAAAAPADSAAVRARLDELLAVHVEESRALREIIRSDSVVIAELRALDLTRVAAIGALEVALADAQQVGETAIEARPGWFERSLPKIGIGLAFAAGWVLSAQLTP